jgi:diaminopimelate decarboxylase
MPISAATNELGHLTIGGCDTVKLAEEFGTPLWVIDEATVRQSARACLEGLSSYGDARALYAGKAFLCLTMCRLAQQMGMGLDVVSEGELYTAAKAYFPPELTYMHGNNKSQSEIDAGLAYGLNIVIDGMSEAQMVIARAAALGKRASALVRVTPGVEPDTHEHIKTGQHASKFGVPLEGVPEIVRFLTEHHNEIDLRGLHAHIGSQGQELEPFLQIIDILGDLVLDLCQEQNFVLRQLDVGGGLGITYTEEDKPAPIYTWASEIAQRVKRVFTARSLDLPQLLVEPGRSIIGTAGVTLYRAGHSKSVANNIQYLALDGGMADNPRPITYQAKYTACVANRMKDSFSENRLTLVGRYCESGDIIIREAHVRASTGDLVGIFATGAYSYSQASNYNRTPRPACVLVADGKAEIIIERENNDDLIRHDRIPKRLS